MLGWNAVDKAVIFSVYFSCGLCVVCVVIRPLIHVYNQPPSSVFTRSGTDRSRWSLYHIVGIHKLIVRYFRYNISRIVPILLIYQRKNTNTAVCSSGMRLGFEIAVCVSISLLMKGMSADADPHYQKLYGRVTDVCSNRRGQPNLSAMKEPRPGRNPSPQVWEGNDSWINS